MNNLVSWELSHKDLLECLVLWEKYLRHKKTGGKLRSATEKNKQIFEGRDSQLSLSSAKILTMSNHPWQGQQTFSFTCVESTTFVSISQKEKEQVS